MKTKGTDGHLNKIKPLRILGKYIKLKERYRLPFDISQSK